MEVMLLEEMLLEVILLELSVELVALMLDVVKVSVTVMLVPEMLDNVVVEVFVVLLPELSVKVVTLEVTVVVVVDARSFHLIVPSAPVQYKAECVTTSRTKPIIVIVPFVDTIGYLPLPLKVA
jgi:hypothetical protein